MPESAGGKALAIWASGREGNTACAAADLLAGWQEAGGTARLLDLRRYGVRPVGDCRECQGNGACFIRDGFPVLMTEVYAADLLVLATPLYWYGPSGQMKVFLDRWSCLLDLEGEEFRARLREKRVALLVAQGEQGFYEALPCLTMLEWFCRYLDMAVATRIVVVGHARADYRDDAAQRRRVQEAGRLLATSPAVSDVTPPWFHVPHVPGRPMGGIFSPDRSRPPRRSARGRGDARERRE